MTTVHAIRTGTIDWVELTTPDLEAATRFYGELLGWGFTSIGDRVLAEIGGRKAAGIAHQDPTIGDMSLPAAWTIAIRVDDLAAAVRRVAELGGVVIDPPEDLPEGWRSAVVRDPNGASLALVQASPDFGIDVRDEPGALTWCDLMTRDTARAAEFYRSLFGWSVQVDADSGYTMFTLDGTRVAGMMQMPTEVPSEAPSHWTPYFAVADADLAVNAATSLGGTVVVAPRRVDSMRFAVIEDPVGAMFSLLESTHSARSPEDRVATPSERSVRERMASLIRTGNARHIVIRDRSGKRVIEAPLTVGIVGAAVAPYAAAVGTMAALASQWSITVTDGEDQPET